MQLSSHHRRSESGSALWFILIAIALLVALTVAITRTSETTEQNGERERDRIEASDILRQGKSLEQAVQKLRDSGNVSENDISFANPIVAGYDNHNCGDKTSSSDDNPCMLYNAEGAGLTYTPPLSDWLDQTQSAQPLYGQWFFHATACVPGIGTAQTGCHADNSTTALIAVLPWIQQSLCIEINRLAGVANLSNPTRPPVLTGDAFAPSRDKFTGTYTASAELASPGGEFVGKQAGCFAGATNPTGGYHFYQVLIQR